MTTLKHFDVEATQHGRLNLRCTRCNVLDRLESPALTLATLVARAERHDREDHQPRPCPVSMVSCVCPVRGQCRLPAREGVAP